MRTAAEALGHSAPSHRTAASQARSRHGGFAASMQRFAVPGLGADAGAAAASSASWSSRPPAAPFAGMTQGSLIGLQEYQHGSTAGIGAMRADQGGAASGCGFVSVGYARFIGRSTGSGQCVALVQAANPDVGSTRSWAAGATVRQSVGAGLQPGTVIATFDQSGRYANARDGSSHAAIYLGQTEQGIQVMDQWAGRPAAVRTIPWSNPGAAAANVASNYRVVVHATA